MKRYQWFPFYRKISVISYAVILSVVALISSLLIIALIQSDSVISVVIVSILIAAMVVLLQIGMILSPVNVRISKKKIRLNISFCRKRVVPTDGKVVFTEVYYFMVRRYQFDPAYDEFKIKDFLYPELVLKKNYVFILYKYEQNFNESSLRDEHGQLLYSQKVVDYFVRLLKNKGNIMIDANYKTYKFLRQVYDFGQFVDMRGVVENKILVYEEKYRREKAERGDNY